MSVDVHYIWCWVSIVFIASRIGADRRVMGIALAIEPPQRWGGFFFLHRTIYTLGDSWIKPVAAGSGQLCICTCNPCLEMSNAEAGRNEHLFNGLVEVVRSQDECRFSIGSDLQPSREETLPTPDQY